METNISILLVTAITVEKVHTILGPDHYLPFVVMAKARSWNMAKTMWITLLYGVRFVKLNVIDKYSHAITGAAIAASTSAILFLGL